MDFSLCAGLKTSKGLWCLNFGRWAPWACRHPRSLWLNVVRVRHFKFLEVDSRSDSDLATPVVFEELTLGLTVFFFILYLVVHDGIVLQVRHRCASCVVSFVPVGEVIVLTC